MTDATRPVCLHDRSEIESFLRRSPALHIYELGDLDDFFWPYTTWYALQAQGQAQQLVLVYTGTPLPVLLAVAEPPADAMGELLHAIVPFLPRRLYAHLSGSAVQALAGAYRAQSHGVHLKMALTDVSMLEGVDTTGVVRLSPADLPELEALYQASYPGNWFDPRMLETGHYFGLRRSSELVTVAGVHVYSPRYRVAALGNVTTHPRFRRQGLSTTVCTRLCQELLRTVDLIGLNVKADNAAAIACYERLGFSHVAEYEEFMLGCQTSGIRSPPGP
jgi:ribosomal protein S18 acetylase RimI-like enzyme